jgi:pyridoxal phosphate enzyme (YggS family)
MIQQNLLEIKQNIAEIAAENGRNVEDVKLVAVSKTYPYTAIKSAMETGQLDFGENRPQEMLEKYEILQTENAALYQKIHWHLIGQLQRNKVKYIAAFVQLIHSVDSEKLLQEIDRQANIHKRTIDCLLQINISDEEQKSGMEEMEAEMILQQISNFPNIRIKGLMGMAAFTEDMALVRAQFRRLRLAKERFSRIENAQIEMKELSMGMSGDYEIAIAEGATLIRIGTAIFGGRH